MKWYPKALNGIDDLQQEKRRLLSVREQASGTDFLFPGMPGREEAATESSPRLFDLLAGLLTSKTALGGIMAAGMPLLRFLPGKLQKKLLYAFAREFFGGYIRWKALTVGFRFVRRFFR